MTSAPDSPPSVAAGGVRVACLQLAPRVGRLAANCEMSAAAVRSAAADGAQLIVLPELVTSGYPFTSADEARDCAIGTDDGVFGEWSAAAGDAVVVGGFCELGADGLVYNSAAVVDSSGLLAVYRKTHLWENEKLVFSPGSQPPPVLNTKAGRIGVLICYDMEFPEMTRGLALAGAQILAVPTNWPWVWRPAGEHPPEVVIAMAAARVNRVFIACSDRCGPERGTDWTEGTAIIDASGWVVAEAGAGPGAATALVEPESALDKAISPLNDVHADRRPELYHRPELESRPQDPSSTPPSPSPSTRSSARSSTPPFTSPQPLAGEAPFETRRRPDLVLLPGMLADQSGWDDVAARLSGHARIRVARIDLDDTVADLAEGVLAEAPDEFALAGHSLGAIVALEVIRRAPGRVRRLALLNSSGRAPTPAQRDAWTYWDERVSAGEFDTVAAELASSTLPARCRADGRLSGRGERMAQQVGRAGFRRQLGAQQSRQDLLATLAAIAVPTLVLSGELDEVSPPALQRELAAGIPGSLLVTLPGVGHMSLLENADAVADEMLAWLRP